MADRKKVLLLEDDDMLRDVLLQGLERGGYVVKGMKDGTDVRDVAMAFRPDLVVTDMIMPETEGVETILDLRTANPELPIIAMSGGGYFDADWHLHLADRFGVSGTLAKPFKIKDLVAQVDQILGAQTEDSA